MTRQTMSYSEALAAVLDRLDRLEELHEQGGGDNSVAAALAEIAARQGEQARRQDEALSLLHELDGKIDAQAECTAALVQWKKDHENSYAALANQVKSNSKGVTATGVVEVILTALLAAFKLGKGVGSP